MTKLTVILREAASEDVDLAVAHYLGEAGMGVAASFIDALEIALAHIGEHPASGSARYATELDLPGLRYWVMGQFPFLIFYVQLESSVDVWRVIHAQRDLPAWLRPPASGSNEVREQLLSGYRVEAVKGYPLRTDLDNVGEVLAEIEGDAYK